MPYAHPFEAVLRGKLAELLRGGESARPALELMREFPFAKAGAVVDPLPYSVWSQVVHLRISQDDIIEFSRDPGYVSPAWPEDHWPKELAPADEAEWNAEIERFAAGLDTMTKMVVDPEFELMAPFAWGDGQTLFRQAVMLAKHNAYHAGQIVVIGRQLGVW